MAVSVSELAVKVTTDNTAMVRLLRTIARHAQACADELAGQAEEPAPVVGQGRRGRQLLRPRRPAPAPPVSFSPLRLPGGAAVAIGP